jgi:hypothetical protein
MGGSEAVRAGTESQTGKPPPSGLVVPLPIAPSSATPFSIRVIRGRWLPSSDLCFSALRPLTPDL